MFSKKFIHRCLTVRSSHKRCFVRKGVLKNFLKFIGKYLCQSLFLIKLQALCPRLLFNKVIYLRRATLLKGDSGTRSATLLKRRLWYRCFWYRGEFCEIFKNSFFAERTIASVKCPKYVSVRSFYRSAGSSFDVLFLDNLIMKKIKSSLKSWQVLPKEKFDLIFMVLFCFSLFFAILHKAINHLMHNVPKWSDTIFQQMLQDY